MTFIEELQEESRKHEEKNKEVIDEITNSFRKYFNGDEFKSYIRNRIGKDEISKRKVKFWTSFWLYQSGCSDTHFLCGGRMWKNPEATGWESKSYKGINLYEISDEVCSKINGMLCSELRELGFTVSVTDNKNRFNYYDKEISASW